VSSWWSDPLQVVPAYPLHKGVELGLKPDTGLASWWNYVLAGELIAMMTGIDLVVFQFATLFSLVQVFTLAAKLACTKFVQELIIYCRMLDPIHTCHKCFISDDLSNIKLSI